MLSVTERAKCKLKKLLSDKTDMPQGRLRLIDRGQGELGFGIDIEMPHDYAVEYEGSNLLVVDPELANRVKGAILDVNDTPGVAEWVISGI